jgi:hypothetical protein
LQVSVNGSTAANYKLLKTGGTETSVSATPSGTMGSLSAYGYTGAIYYYGGSIDFVATENWSGFGTGTQISFNTTPTGTGVPQLSGFIAASGSWATGMPTLATNATSGFTYIPVCGGPPTGTPETIAGRAPLVIDNVNSKLYAFIGGAWKSTTLT